MTLGNHIVHYGLVTCPVTDWLLSANKVSLNLDVTTNILFSSGPKEEQDKGEQYKGEQDKGEQYNDECFGMVFNSLSMEYKYTSIDSNIAIHGDIYLNIKL